MTWSKVLLPPTEKCPNDFYQQVVFTYKFYNRSPSVTRDKEFVMWLWGNDITSSWGRVLNGILWMRLPAVQIYVSIPPMIRYIWIFKLVILLTLRSPKLMVILITLDKSKLTLVVYFYCFEQVSYFTEFEQDIKPWKTIQILSVWQKIQEPHIGSATSHLQWFN